jgi:hypothetical protein
MAIRISVSTRADSPEPLTSDEQTAAINRILASSCFAHAPGLHKFLQFVGNKAIQGLSHEIKEHSIAANVLERPVEYDSRTDTTIRVQARRLREKLKEYYVSEGAADEVIVDLPKGQYAPRFSRGPVQSPRGTSGAETSSGGPQVSTAEGPDRSDIGQTGQRHGKKVLLRFAMVASGLLLFFSGALSGPWLRKSILTQGQNVEAVTRPGVALQPDSPLRTLWAGFFQNSRSVAVIYPDVKFLATETSDLFRLKSDEAGVAAGAPVRGNSFELAENPRLLSHAGPVFFSDGYTGTGELMAVHRLSELFSSAGLALRMQGSASVTTNDLKSENLVFVGSTLRHSLLEALPLGQNFVFAKPEKPPFLWRTRIVNLHPLPGESASYELERDEKTQMIRADYALISFLPGIVPDHVIAILGGLTTLGAQGAAEFVSSQSRAAELLRRFGTAPGAKRAGQSRCFFQAIVKVETRRGEITSLAYVTGRLIRPLNSER